MTETTAIIHAPETRGELAQADSFMPVMSIEQAILRHNSFVNFAKTVMREGVDYGVIPGTEKKAKPGEPPSSRNNTLLKPGAEKLCTLFGLVPDFQDYKVQEDWTAGFFYYAFRCILSRNGRPVASGIGSCNSREKKYRRVSKVCPACNKPTIIKSKYAPRNSGRPNDEGGWWCAPRDGGCSENFVIDDPEIVNQSGSVDPMAAADLVNTIQKMAQKRALVAATLVATSASEFFTQDVEDMGFIDAEWTPHTQTPSATEPHDAAEPSAEETEVIRLSELIDSSPKPPELKAFILKQGKVGALAKLPPAQVRYWIKWIADKESSNGKKQEPATAAA